MPDWSVGYPIDYSESGDETGVAIGKAKTEFSRIYTLLNRLRKLDAGASAPIDPVTYHLYLNTSGATPKFQFYNGSSFEDLTIPPSSTPTYLATMRNVVLSGQVLTSTGVPSWVQAGAGLTAALYASTVPVVVSFAAGSDSDGTVDHLVRFTADNASAWSGLAASSTLYLYIDRNPATEAITFGATTAVPKRQKITPAESTGCIWYNPATGVTQRWSGASWVEVQRVVVAKVTTNAASVTEVLTVPFLGFFDYDPLGLDHRLDSLTVGSLTATSLASAVRPYVKLTHQEAAGGSSGSAIRDAWTKRTINTEVSDANSLCTLSSSQITLAAGTYRVHAWFKYYETGAVKTRLRNVTTGTTLMVSSISSTSCDMSGYITVADGQVLEVQYFADDDYQSGDGFGGTTGSSSGEIELFAQMEFWKES